MDNTRDFMIWKRAEMFYSLGRIADATALYQALLVDEQFFVQAKLRLTEIGSSNGHAFDLSSMVLVWQTGIHDETSIVRRLLKDVKLMAEVDDSSPDRQHQHNYSIFYPNMIVVDHAIRGLDSFNYYHKCKQAGCNVILIHLADEAYIDLTEIYDCCRVVYRNYWSPVYNKIKNVHFFPLGSNAGEKHLDVFPARPASGRKYIWNFLGDSTKADRRQALEDFSGLLPNRLHLVEDFFDSKKMSFDKYIDVLSNSKFTICPDGNVNVDTFRFWESIEFGSIPLIVNRSGYIYFESLLNSNLPFPTFSSWQGARIFVENICNDSVGMDYLQSEMMNWWRKFKIGLSEDFRCSMLDV